MPIKKKEEKKFYKIPVNIYDGTSMINLFTLMGGGDQEKILRSEVKKQFIEIFPESSKPEEEKPSKTEKRIMELSKRHIRAVAHNLISLYGAEETKGQLAEHIEKIAEAWFLWPYMREMIGPESYPEFEGELANEPELVAANAEEVVKEIEKPGEEKKEE